MHISRSKPKGTAMEAHLDLTTIGSVKLGPGLELRTTLGPVLQSISGKSSNVLVKEGVAQRLITISFYC
jgi:hypothetical protein